MNWRGLGLMAAVFACIPLRVQGETMESVVQSDCKLEALLESIPESARNRSKVLSVEKRTQILALFSSKPSVCRYLTSHLLPALSRTATRMEEIVGTYELIEDGFAREQAQQRYDRMMDEFERGISLLEFLVPLAAGAEARELDSFVARLEANPKLSPEAAIYEMLAETDAQTFSAAVAELCKTADQRGVCSTIRARRLLPYREMMNLMPSEVIFFRRGSTRVASSAMDRLRLVAQSAAEDYLEKYDLVALVVARTSVAGGTRSLQMDRIAEQRAIAVASAVSEINARVVPRIISLPQSMQGVFPIRVRHRYLETVLNLVEGRNREEIDNPNALIGKCMRDGMKPREACVTVTAALLGQSAEVFFLPVSRHQNIAEPRVELPVTTDRSVPERVPPQAAQTDAGTESATSSGPRVRVPATTY